MATALATLGWGRDELADPAALRDAVPLAVDVAVLTCQRLGADPPRRAELEETSRNRNG